MNDARTCKHSTLRFGSGAYYVSCEGCTRRWVAITGPKDTDIDYDAGADQVCGETRSILPKLTKDEK